MLSYCLKCRKNTGNKNLKLPKQKPEKWYFNEAMQFLVVKDWDLLKSKKLVKY